MADSVKCGIGGRQRPKTPRWFLAGGHSPSNNCGRSILGQDKRQVRRPLGLETIRKLSSPAYKGLYIPFIAFAFLLL